MICQILHLLLLFFEKESALLTLTRQLLLVVHCIIFLEALEGCIGEQLQSMK